MEEDKDEKEVFEGFSVPNGTIVPDEFFDVALARITNLAEIKVIAYTIRRTFGFKKHQDRISISQYVDGITTREGRVLDSGTGLARSSVVVGLDKAVTDGYLEKEMYCRNCNSPVEKSETVERRFKNQKTEGVSQIAAVPRKCPKCQRALEGQINVYYSLKLKPVKPINKGTEDDQSEFRTGGSPDFGLGPVRISDSQQTVLQQTENKNNVNVGQVIKKKKNDDDNDTVDVDLEANLLQQVIDYTEDANPKSIGSFRKVIRKLGSGTFDRIMGYTKDAVRSGTIPKSKSAAYFIGTAKNMAEERGIDLGFNTNDTKPMLSGVADLKAKIGNSRVVRDLKAYDDEE